MKLKPLPSKKVILILEKLGFKKIRQRGSHIFFRHVLMGGQLSSQSIREKILAEACSKKSSRIQN